MKRLAGICIFLLLGVGFCFSNSVQASIYLGHSELGSTERIASKTAGELFSTRTDAARNILQKVTHDATYSRYSAYQYGKIFKEDFGGVIKVRNFERFDNGKQVFGAFYYNGNVPTITLYKGANKSTLFHEFFHSYDPKLSDSSKKYFERV